MKYSHILFCVAACMLTSCGLKKERITDAPPVRVTIQAVNPQAVGALRSYSGTVESGDGSEVSFAVGGTVRQIYVTPGQKVAKGQLLAELKSETAENAYSIAQATLAEARDAYNRLKKLHDADALPDMQWVEVQSKLTQAENAAEIAARGVTDTRLYAPMEGVVANKTIDVGQTVLPAVPVMEIVGLGDVKVSISVPEEEISAMRPGREATVTIEALDGRELPAQLTEENIVANPLTRAYDVKFKVANSNGDILPGMLCTVDLQPQAADSAAQAAIVLPPQAVLLSADNRNFVWLSTNGRAERRFVEQGGITADGIVISSGLARGDSVIVAGMQKVSQGTHVEPIN